MLTAYSQLANVTFLVTFLLSSLAIHADLEPYLLFADGIYDTIYRSYLDGSGIQWLVTGLPHPAALDFDYRYNVICSKYKSLHNRSQPNLGCGEETVP